MIKQADPHTKLTCTRCGRPSSSRSWIKNLAVAAELSPADARFSPTERVDSEQRIVSGVIVAASSMPDIFPGTHCILLFGPSRITVLASTPHGMTGESCIGYREVNGLTVGGAGASTYTTDAGLVGGGFGFKGALEGMAIAGAVNAMTRTTTSTMDTTVHLNASPREILIQTYDFEPAVLRVMLSPTFQRIHYQAREQSSTPAQTTINAPRLHAPALPALPALQPLQHGAWPLRLPMAVPSGPPHSRRLTREQRRYLIAGLVGMTAMLLVLWLVGFEEMRYDPVDGVRFGQATTPLNGEPSRSGEDVRDVILRGLAKGIEAPNVLIDNTVQCPTGTYRDGDVAHCTGQLQTRTGIISIRMNVELHYNGTSGDAASQWSYDLKLETVK